MKQLRLRDGDLVLGLGSRLEFVYGREKLKQALKLWIREPLGAGFTTEFFGSQLESLVGEVVNAETATLIKSEVERVVLLYQANQINDLKEARSEGRLRDYDRSEILAELTSVEVKFLYDTAQVIVLFKTMTNETLDEILTIELSTTNGIEV